VSTNMFLDLAEPSVPQFEILSWNHGFSQPASPTRSSAGAGAVEQASHSNLTFTKYLDANSNELMKYCWSGRQFGKATLTCYRSDGSIDNKPVKHLEIVMQRVIIANISISGGPGDIPVENVALDYGIVEYKYVEHKRMLTMDKVAGTIA
jgi:type VI secretion system secreted protein Hcp